LVKTWQVIFATLVIFIAGIVTGAMVTRRAIVQERPKGPRSAETVGKHWNIQRPEFFSRLKVELKLEPDQAAKIETILKQSHQRTEPLWDLINPLLQEELGKVRTEIKAVLAPEQQKKFDELLKPRAPREKAGSKGGAKADGARSQTSDPRP
jgi:Spy/CpxP family protein refolding chaperone